MEFDILNALTRRFYRIYKAVYNQLENSPDPEDFFVQAGVPLDGNVASDPTIRRRVGLFVTIDKVLSTLLAGGTTLIIAPFVIFQVIMYNLFCLFLYLLFWIKFENYIFDSTSNKVLYLL